MILYKKGDYKYRLVETYTVQTPIYPDEDIETKYISLSTAGLLTLRDSYAWDGPSGPTIDTKNFMRGSLVHDSLYQLMRMGLLNPQTCRGPADRLLRKMCIEDGMSQVRAWWVYRSLYRFGGRAATGPAKPILTAP